MTRCELTKSMELMAKTTGHTPEKYVSIQVASEIELMARSIQILEKENAELKRQLKEETDRGFEMSAELEILRWKINAFEKLCEKAQRWYECSKIYPKRK